MSVSLCLSVSGMCMSVRVYPCPAARLILCMILCLTAAGSFTVKNVLPGADGESQKVKLKVRVNLHGVFTVASATLLERVEEAPAPAPDTAAAAAAPMETEPTAAAGTEEGAAPAEPAAEGDRDTSPPSEAAMDTDTAKTEAGADSKEVGRGRRAGPAHAVGSSATSWPALLKTTRN